MRDEYSRSGCHCAYKRNCHGYIAGCNGYRAAYNKYWTTCPYCGKPLAKFFYDVRLKKE